MNAQETAGGTIKLWWQRHWSKLGTLVIRHIRNLVK